MSHRGRRTRISLLSNGLAVVLIAAGISVVAGPVSASAAESATEAADVATAYAAAKRSGQPVEVLSEKDSKTRVWVNPSGTLTAEVNAVPARLQREGRWLDYDMTLRKRADGTVAPAVHPNDLVLAGASGPGQHDLASVQVLGERLGLGWQGKLPQPVLSGATATYAEVLPGIDLVVKARDGGFEQHFLVKDRNAAPRLSGVKLSMRAGKGTFATQADGSGEWRAADGKVLARMPQPRMWDARGQQRDGEKTRQHKVDMTLKGSEATLMPDQGWLADPAVLYPVSVDPGLNVELKVGFDEFVQNTIGVSDNQSEDLLKLGYSDDSTCVAEDPVEKCRTRSYLRFDSLAPYRGSKIYSARLHLYEFHAWSCTAFGWRATRTDAVSGSVQWGNQPAWRESASISNETKGGGSCADGWVTTDVAPLMDDGLTAGTLSMVVHAAGDDSRTSWSVTDHLSWKKFDSNEGANKPKIVFEYNHLPTVSNVRVQDDGSCSAGAGLRKYINTLKPTFKADVKDDDKAPRPSTNVKLQVQITPVGGSALPIQESVPLAPNSTISVAWSTPLQANTTYIYQVRAVDLTGTGAPMDYSAWSPPCEIQYDAATLASPPVVEGIPVFTEDGIDYHILNYGEPVKVTFRPGAGDEGRVAAYRYAFSEAEIASPNATTVPAGNDGSASAVITRWDADSDGIPIWGPINLYVRAVTVSAASFSTNVLEVNNTALEAPEVHRVPGDLNGDGHADLSGLRDLGNGSGVFYSYQGNEDGSLSTPAHLIWGTAYTAATAKPVQGDFDGDGKTDFAAFQTDGPADVGLKSIRSDGNALRDVEVWSSTQTTANAGKWVLGSMRVMAADVNTDGKDDLIVGYPNGVTDWTVKVFLSFVDSGQTRFGEPATWLTVAGDLGKVKLVAGRFDGNPGADVASFSDMGSCRTILRLHPNTGTQFAAGAQVWDTTVNVGGTPTNVNWCLANAQLAVGDFANSGRDGVAAAYDNGSCGLSLQSFSFDGGSHYAVRQWTSPGNAELWCTASSEFALRDLTGDRKADMVLTYRCCGSYQQRILVFASTGSLTFDTLTAVGPRVGNPALFTAPQLKAQAGLGPIGVGNVETQPGTRYQLVAKHSGKCLTISGGSVAEGAAAVQQTCAPGQLNQQFSLQARGAAYHRLHPAHTETKCLNVSGALTTDGRPIIHNTCTAGQTNETFQLDYVTGTTYVPGSPDEVVVKLVSTLANKCVGISGTSQNDGAAAVQWTCNGSYDQNFYLRPLDPPIASIYGILSDGRLTYSTIDEASGDRLSGLVSTGTLGFTPKAMATLNLDTLLVTSTTGALYRVDITARKDTLAFDPPVQLAASGWVCEHLAFDGNGHLFAIFAGTLHRYDVLEVKPNTSDIVNDITVGSGFTLASLTATGPDWVIGTTSSGTLRSYRILGANSWLGYTIGEGWTFPHVLSPGGGVYYGHTATGGMNRYLDGNPFDGAGADLYGYQSDPVSTSGWNETLISANLDVNVGGIALPGPALVTDNGDGTVSTHMWRSTGASFGRSTVHQNGVVDLSTIGERVASGDVDGDGRPDVVMVQQNANGTFSAHVYKSGTGQDTVWLTGPTLDLARVGGRMVVADFTGDRKADLALVHDNGNSTMSIHRWTSTGSAFGSQATYTSGTFSLGPVADRAAAGDVTGDGKADIVLAYQRSEGTFSFYVWNAGITYAGIWYTSGPFSLSRVGGRFVVADFTGDGKADPAVGYDMGDGTMRIYRWTSTGTAFGSTAYWTSGPFTISLVGDRMAAADVTGDGIADVVMGYRTGSTVGFYVFPNANSSRGRWLTSSVDPSTSGGRMMLGNW